MPMKVVIVENDLQTLTMYSPMGLGLITLLISALNALLKSLVLQITC